MTWILIIYFGSVGVFLVLYCLCCLMKKEMRDIAMWKVFKEAFYPVFNIVMCLGFLFIFILSLYEKVDVWVKIWILDKEMKRIFRK